jgi:hypothetical protein
MAPLVETIANLCHLHPLAEVDLPLFANDFHLEINFVLDRDAFISTLKCSPHRSSGEPLGMVCELL